VESETATTAPATCQLLDVKDVARLLRIHPRTAWRLSSMAEAGLGNFPKLLRVGPKTIRWRLSDVQAYLATLAGESTR